MGLVRVVLTSDICPDFWEFAYEYEDYMKERFEKLGISPAGEILTGKKFQEFFKDKTGFDVITHVGDKFGTFYMNENDYVWFKLKWL
jgi:hypothetical protein